MTPTASARLPAPTRRAALGIAGAGVLAAALASCSRDGEAMPAGVATIVEDGRIEDPPWQVLPFRTSHAIEFPGVRYLVREAGTTATLTRDDAVRLFVETPEETGEDGLVRAADGETFLVVHLAAIAPLFLPLEPADGQERTERILIGGTSLETGREPMRPVAGSTVSIVCSIPEDAAPDHARLEVTGGLGTQTLSLVDGRRLDSPIEHLYDQRFVAEPAPLWWERRDAELVEDGPVIAGTVFGVQVPAMRADGTWPEPGTLPLGVHLSTISTRAGVTETSTLTMLLPDGGEAAAVGDPSRAFVTPPQGEEATRPLAWFEVPHDTEHVTLRVRLSARTEAGEHALGTEEIPVTIRREQR